MLSYQKSVTQDKASADPTQVAIGGNQDQRQPIFAHCLDFTEGEQEYFYVGSEDFNIYQCKMREEEMI